MRLVYTHQSYKTIDSEAGVQAGDRRARFREPTPEERTELNETLGELLDAIALENAIARAKRSTPDKAGRTRRMSRNVGAMVRQLRFWEGKGQLQNDAIYKTDREWYETEGGLTRSQLETATRVGVEEGLFEVFHVMRPSDDRRVTAYRLNLLRATHVACESERDRLEEVLEHEERPKYREELEEKLRRVWETLEDLELVFGADEEEEPEETAEECTGGPDCFCDECFWIGEDEGHDDLNPNSQLHNLDTLNCSTQEPSTAQLTQTTEENLTRSRQRGYRLTVGAAGSSSSGRPPISSDEIDLNVTEEGLFPSRDKPTSVAEDDGEEEIEITEADLCF